MLQCLEIITETKANMTTETEVEAIAEAEETTTINRTSSENTTVKTDTVKEKMENIDLEVENHRGELMKWR